MDSNIITYYRNIYLFRGVTKVGLFSLCTFPRSILSFSLITPTLLYLAYQRRTPINVGEIRHSLMAEHPTYVMGTTVILPFQHSTYWDCWDLTEPD